MDLPIASVLKFLLSQAFAKDTLIREDLDGTV